MTTPAVLAQRDPIYGRISRAVPRTVDPMLREDIMSTIYLAIREGQLVPREVDTKAKAFISAAFAAWSNRWGTLSLDASIGEPGSVSFVELIEDEASLAAFDHIVFRHEELHR